MGGPQICFCLFMVRSITLKQLNSLMSIDTFSCLGSQKVTHYTVVPEVPSLIPRSFKDLYACFFVLLLRFYFFGAKTIASICHEMLIFFCNAVLFSILNILVSLWSIKRVPNYTPDIRFHTNSRRTFPPDIQFCVTGKRTIFFPPHIWFHENDLRTFPPGHSIPCEQCKAISPGHSIPSKHFWFYSNGNKGKFIKGNN